MIMGGDTFALTNLAYAGIPGAASETRNLDEASRCSAKNECA
jgi:hypothetical protein